MRTIECEQSTPEWRAARAAIPTASQFHRILTTAKRRLAEGRFVYRDELLAEWLIGQPLEGSDGGGSGFMGRGTGLEDKAREWYDSPTRDVTVTRVGFCVADSGLYGCSPDGLVNDDGLVQFKVPALKTFVGALLSDAPDVDYYPQCQGEMLVTGRAWNDLVIWHPTLPPRVVRVLRDGEYIGLLAHALTTFCAEIEDGKSRLLALGCEPAEREAATTALQESF